MTGKKFNTKSKLLIALFFNFQKITYIALLFILNFSVSAQTFSDFGYPLMQTYKHDAYGGSPQTWDIAQDNSGILYVATTSGFYEFDGSLWTEYRMSSKTGVRELVMSKTYNRLFIGGENDFGVLEYKPNGERYFKSLTHLLPDTLREFGFITSMEEYENKIVVASNKMLFYYENGKIVVLDVAPHYKKIITANQHTFIFSNQFGLFELIDTKLFNVEGSEFFAKIGILIIDEVAPDKFKILTLMDGVYEMEGEKITKIDSIDVRKITTSYMLKGEIFNDYYLIGTYYSGLYVLDKNFNILRQFTENDGLTNDAIVNIYKDKNQNLWLSTMGGITFLETSSAFTSIDERTGIADATLSIYSTPDFLYFGCLDGAFALNRQKKEAKFAKMNNIQSPVWSIEKHNDKILATTNSTGIFQLKDTTNQRVTVNSSWNTKEISKNKLLLGDEEFGTLEIEGDNYNYNLIKGFEGECRWFALDENKNIWNANSILGIYKFELNHDFDSIQNQTIYDTLKGLPFNNKNYLWIENNQILAGTQKGIYRYDRENDNFEDWTELSKQIDYKDVWLIKNDEQENIWFTGLKIYGVFEKQNDQYVFKDKPFSRFVANDIHQVHVHNSDTVFFCFPNEVLMYEKNKENDINPKYPCLVRKVEFLDLEHDTIKNLFAGYFVAENEIYTNQSQNDIPKIDYKKNSLKFTFSAPLFEDPEKTRFSYRMQGYSENWSDWSELNFKEYTNLKEGSFIFEVKAKNAYNAETEIATYSFTVLPPWYRTWWAYLLYVIFTVGAGFFLVKFYTRRLVRQKQRLEKIVDKRTKEVRKQKEEIELQHEELYQQKEEILAQAEQLLEINKELEKLSIVAAETDNAIIITDREGRFEWINDGFSNLYGYSFSELTKKYSTLTDLSSSEKISDLINACIENGEPQIYESVARTKGGEGIWVQTTLTPILDEMGEVYKIIAIDSDIRKLKQVESELTLKNQHITDSIRYAKTIQKAILPIDEQIAKHFDNFILFRPKDIVSGDFYWFVSVDSSQKGVPSNQFPVDTKLGTGNSELTTVLGTGNSQLFFLAAIDCTGHGVPGAFMSMIGSSLLNQILYNDHEYNTANILTKLNKLIIRSLRQDKTDNNDGMDVCLTRIEKNDKGANIQFTGAKRPLAYIKAESEKVELLKGDRKSIGGTQKKAKIVEFTTQEITLKKGSLIYLTSDGYTDQNNFERKRFGSTQFISILEKIKNKDMQTQHEILNSKIKSWMKNTQQRDDITVIGVKI